MFKKVLHGTKEIRDWFKNRMHSTWNRMSRGAAEIARMIPYAHGENWRRQDKHQKNHDNHHHKCHKYK